MKTSYLQLPTGELVPITYGDGNLGGLDFNAILGALQGAANTVQNVARGISNATAGAQAGLQSSGSLFDSSSADQAAQAIDRLGMVAPGGQAGLLYAAIGVGVLVYLSARKRR